jgi:hypothetical protein
MTLTDQLEPTPSRSPAFSRAGSLVSGSSALDLRAGLVDLAHLERG